MKLKYYLQTGILVFVLFIFSCKKYLSVKPDLTLVSPISLQDAQALLDYSSTMNINATPSLIEAGSDDYFLPTTFYNSLPTYYQESYLWKYYTYNYPNDWASCYLPVYNANYCIEITRKNERTDKNKDLWDQVHGSSLFFRSFYFLELLMAYSKAYNESTAGTDLGIPLRQSSDFNEKSMRASVKECYNFIVTDLKIAAKELKDLPDHVLRPSKCAAYGLLARTYLLMDKYDSALRYSNLSLSIKNTLINYNATSCSDCDITLPLVSAAAVFRKYNSEIIFYTEMSGNVTPHQTSESFIDTTLYDSYSSNDLRKIAFFLPVDEYYLFKGSYTQNNDYLFTGLTTAEMYLISAECYARLNNVDSAIDILNKFLLNRMAAGTFLPFNSSNIAVVLEKILSERRKELLFRGLRWSDIKRLNIMGGNILLRRFINENMYALEPNANYYALPLPSDIIISTGMQQNPL